MENAELIQAVKNEFALLVRDGMSYAELHEQLSVYINELIKNDFDKLVTHLYRIDVSEAALKKLIRHHENEDAGNIIATMMLERQQQKIKSRSLYSGKNSYPSEEERW